MIWKHRLTGAPKNEDIESEELKIITTKDLNPSPQGNKIYYYEDITRIGILNLNRQIDDLTKTLKCVQIQYDLPKPPIIELHISSEGGDVFSAFSAVDKIATNSIPIYVYCEGIVASAATLVSCSGHKRFITKNSCMLIHQVRSTFWGNYMQFQDEATNLSLLMDLIVKIYLQYTGLTEKELKDLLKHDLYLNAEQCVEKGLVDKVL